MNDLVKVHLYEIANSFKGLEKLVEDGELTIEEAADTFEGLEGDFTQKVQQILAMYRNYEAFADSAKAEIERLAAVAKSAENRALWLKSYIHSQMDRLKMKTVKTILGTCTIQGGADSVVIDEPLDIPDEFVDYKPELAYVPKKDAIKKAINAGNVVPGAHLVTGPDFMKITTPRAARQPKE